MADLGAQHKIVASDDGATVTTTDGSSYKKIGNFWGYPGMSLYTHDDICYGNLETGGGAGTGIRSKSGIPVINQYDSSKNGIIATSDLSFNPIRGLKTTTYDHFFVNSSYNSHIGSIYAPPNNHNYVLDADFDKNGNLLEFISGSYNYNYDRHYNIKNKYFVPATGGGVALLVNVTSQRWESNDQVVELSPTGWDLVGLGQIVMYGGTMHSHSSWADSGDTLLDIDFNESEENVPVIAGNATIDLKQYADEAETLCRRGISEMESKHPASGRPWPPIEKPDGFVSYKNSACYYGRVFSDGSWYAYVTSSAGGYAFPSYSWQDGTISTYKSIKSWRMSADTFAGIQGEIDYRVAANTFTATRWRPIYITSGTQYLITSNGGAIKLAEGYDAEDWNAESNGDFSVRDYTAKEKKEDNGYYINRHGGWTESCFGLPWSNTEDEITSIGFEDTDRTENFIKDFQYSGRIGATGLSMPIGGGFTAKGTFSNGQIVHGTIYDPDGNPLEGYTDTYLHVLGAPQSPGLTGAKTQKGSLILDYNNIRVLNKEGKYDQESQEAGWKLPYSNANYRLCRMNRSKFVQQNRDPSYNPNTGSSGGGGSL